MKTAILIPLLCLLLACSPEEEQKPSVSAHTLAEQGSIESLQSLLSTGTAVDSRDSCAWTPLMKAALNGQTQTVEFLLDNGANLNAEDKGGYTPLLLAASNNHVETVALLLDRGADINHPESSMGWTALIWSTKNGYLETASLLVERGASTSIKDLSGMTALNWALKIKAPELQHLLINN
jgi:ankyrin repeat protein